MFVSSIVETKLVNYFNFPELIYLHEKIYDDEELYPEYVHQDLLNLSQKYSQELMPYKDEISKFYLDDFNISRLFFRILSFRNITDPTEYMDRIKSLTKEECIDVGIKYIQHCLSEHDPNPPEIQNELSFILSSIQEIETSEASKWILSQYFLNPLDFIAKWFQLLEKVKPLFEVYYSQFESEIITCTEKTLEGLNDTSKDYMFEITTGRAGKDLLSGNLVLISIINPYIVAIEAHSSNGFLLWGLRIEPFMKNVKEVEALKKMVYISTFKILGDKTRYDVMKCISDGITSTKKIAEILGVSPATISYHLSSLVNAKLLKYVKQGKRYTHVINTDWIQECFKQLSDDFKIESLL